MNGRCGLTLAVPMLLLSLATISSAQNSELPGRVQGVVADQTGAVLSGATVNLTGLESGLSRTTSTDSSGSYAFESVAPGRYRVLASYPGLDPASSGDVLVSADQQISVPLSLEVSGTEAVVMVTASTRAQSLREVQASAQVITAEEIRAYAGANVTEALKLAVGVDARSSGANSSVSIRGFTASAGSAVLMLIDGLRRTGKYGSTNLNLFELEGVERLEVVRGPMSALYGADATGGVINVITKPVPVGVKPSGTLRLLAGSMRDGQRSTFIEGGSFQFGTAEVGHRVSVEQRNRGLFRFVSSTPTADLSRIDETFVGYQGDAPLPRAQTLRWTLEFVNQDDTAPGLLAAAPPARPVAQPFDSHEREKRSFASTHYGGRLGPGALQLDAGFGRSHGSTTRSFPQIETTDYDQSQAQGRYYFVAGPHAVVVGAGVIHDTIDVTNFLSKQATRTNASAMVQDEWRVSSHWNVLVGIRGDHFTDFGSVATPRASVIFKTGPWSLRAGYGQAYRAPSVIEQYSTFLRGRFLITGDPTLQPEINRTVEMAAAIGRESVQAELVFFDSRVTDLIQSVTLPRQPQDPSTVQFRSQYSNVAKARLRGAELTATWRATDWLAMTGAWDHLEAFDDSTSARLTARARQNLRGNLRLQHGRWRADIRTRKYIDFYAADPNVRTSPAFNTSFATSDVKIDVRLTNALSVAGGIDNLANRRQPINFSSTGGTLEPPGRYGYLGARIGF